MFLVLADRAGPEHMDELVFFAVGAVAVSFPRLSIAIHSSYCNAALQSAKESVLVCSDLLAVIIIDKYFCVSENPYDEDDDELTPDLWQEACWIVIRSV